MSRGGDWIHPPTRYAIVWFRDSGRCLACGWRPEERFGSGLVLDHVVPLSAWRPPRPDWPSPHSAFNLATLCKPCHDKRGTRPWQEFFAGPALNRMLRHTARQLTRWHRRRGYFAAVRQGRYRRAANAEKCRGRRVEQAYLREERRAIHAYGGG